MKDSKSKVFMAFAKGVETKEFEIKRFVGIAPVKVLAVNPNKKELESFYGREMEEPVYIDTVKNKEDKDVKRVRLNFIIQPDPQRVSVTDNVFSMSLYLRHEYMFNKDKTKVRVIDKYGRTAWVSVEQAKNHEIPIYSNGPAKIDKNYRPAFIGEKELIDFVKCYLGIPNIEIYDNKTGMWIVNSNPSDCEASFSNIEKFFEGNIKELQEAFTYQPNNFVRVLFGVREADDKIYQTYFTNKFAKNNDFSKTIENALKEIQNNGGLSTSIFELGELKEYKPVATDFNTVNTNADLPLQDDELPW